MYPICMPMFASLPSLQTFPSSSPWNSFSFTIFFITTIFLEHSSYTWQWTLSLHCHTCEQCNLIIVIPRSSSCVPFPVLLILFLFPNCLSSNSKPLYMCVYILANEFQWCLLQEHDDELFIGTWVTHSSLTSGFNRFVGNLLIPFLKFFSVI